MTSTLEVAFSHRVFNLQLEIEIQLIIQVKLTIFWLNKFKTIYNHQQLEARKRYRFSRLKTKALAKLPSKKLVACLHTDRIKKK